MIRDLIDQVGDRWFL